MKVSQKSQPKAGPPLAEKLKTQKLEENNAYDPAKIERKWQDYWEQHKIFSPDLDHAKKPWYNLMMFPYPSAEGMHVGNMYAFTGADVYGRFKRMQGYDVFEPIGLDGFGIHSENYALKIGKHPMEQAKVSEKNFYRQLRQTGNSYDWTRTVETYDPAYYKWTQWLFIQMFKRGLAYRKKAQVNWCPSCKTVLADEQVVRKSEVGSQKSEGNKKSEIRNPKSEIWICERCETPVEKRELEQWFFRITHYADRLLNNIPRLNWTEKVKLAQEQWIGKSEGTRISFKVLGDLSSLALENSPDVGSGLNIQPTRLHKLPPSTISRIEVFTTRPDTLFGATFMVLSPEHEIVQGLLNGELGIKDQELKKIREYVKEAKRKTEEERISEGKEKTGVFSGLYAINPVNQEKIPVWIADYVLMEYGTGAIMAVPAHDQRDFEFARKYNLSIRQVISPSAGAIEKLPRLSSKRSRPSGSDPRGAIEDFKEAYTGEGIIVNSGHWNGWRVPDEISKVIDWLEEKGIGKREVSFHLRDWLISRQRYWGAPIPMIYCSNCAEEGKSWFTREEAKKAEVGNGKWEVSREMGSGKEKVGKYHTSHPHFLTHFPHHTPTSMPGWYPVGEKDLPVKLPFIEDYRPLGTGKAPLANHPEFYNVKCPGCGSDAKRETDVSDTFLDSSWYFFRYLSTEADKTAFDTVRCKKWLPVSIYIGGAEHSVLHLLYSRFITMFMHDLGLISFEEPYSRFFAHGLIISEGAKMSKSRGNVVVPDKYIAKYGADTLRLYLMFIGPFSQGGDFRDTGVEGMHRFLKRIWSLVFSNFSLANDQAKDQRPKTKDRLVMMHKTIKAVTKDLESLSYNTAIARLMEWHNFLKSEVGSQKSEISRDEVETFLKLFAPFAPHATEELWQRIHTDLRADFHRFDQRKSAKDHHWKSIHIEAWPCWDEKYLVEDYVTIVIQVNGKKRSELRIKNQELRDQGKIEKEAKVKIKKYLEGNKIRNVVYVEGKIINFVIS